MDNALLARYFAGTCTEAEKKEVEAWLARDEALPETAMPGNKALKAAGWRSLKRRTQQGRRLRPALRFAAAAALLLAVSAGGYFLYQFRMSVPVISWQTVNNPGGRSMKVSLPDGSAIQLNGGAVLQYPAAFAGEERTVRLSSGEAFFDIAADASPFVVFTEGESKVRVLGTRFNIRRSRVSDKLEITLASGKISFEGADQQRQILKPGEQLIYSVTAKATPIPHSVDTAMVLGWKTGVLQFNDTPLREVLASVESYYGVEFTGKQPAPQLITARFAAKPLDEVLSVIGRSADLRFERKENKITIY